VQHIYIALQHNDDGANIMANKVKSPVKTARKSAAAKTVTSAAPKTQEKLVSKIVTVEPTSIQAVPNKTGVKNMTTTVENTTETVTAKAKDFFADMQVRAVSAADKGKKLTSKAFEFQKANFAAMVEAGKIVAKGAQDLGKTNVEFAKNNFAEMQVAAKEIAAVRTPTDFIKVQSAWTKKGFDTAVAQGSKNTESLVKLVSEMFQPISNRIAVTTDLFKKAA
jgi:phasin family protein